MAYGARLESVLGASPRGFESPILRHQSGTVRFRIFYALFTSTFPALATPRLLGLKDEKSWSEPDFSALWCGKVWFKVVGGQL